MGSLEDLFERDEIAYHSYDDIVNYLSDKGARNKNSYRNVATILSEPAGIREEFESTEEVNELKTLKKQAQLLDISTAKKELTKDINKKIKSVEKELEKLSEQRKEERLRLEREEAEREKLKERMEDIQSDLDRVSSLADIRKVQKRIENLRDKKIDVSNLESQAEELSISYKEQEITGELRRQAKRTQAQATEEAGEGEYPYF